jgi:hypothetical protein
MALVYSNDPRCTNIHSRPEGSMLLSQEKNWKRKSVGKFLVLFCVNKNKISQNLVKSFRDNNVININCGRAIASPVSQLFRQIVTLSMSQRVSVTG